MKWYGYVSLRFIVTGGYLNQMKCLETCDILHHDVFIGICRPAVAPCVGGGIGMGIGMGMGPSPGTCGGKKPGCEAS